MLEFSSYKSGSRSSRGFKKVVQQTLQKDHRIMTPLQGLGAGEGFRQSIFDWSQIVFIMRSEHDFESLECAREQISSSSE